MFERSKGSGDYLGQIRNNVEEKTGMALGAMNAGKLPRSKDGKIRIVELGTGGGESLRELNGKVADADNAELIAIDIIPELAASLKKELDIEAIAADASHLPFADSSESAINASAIIHEVSSYGSKDETGKVAYGTQAVAHAFSEFDRVLMPEGIVAYRDVLAPLGGIREMKTAVYGRKSWASFADWFLADFLESEPRMYDAASVKAEKKDGNLALSAPAGLQREFQRHYLMLRDYLRTVKPAEFGITTVRSDWLDKDAGLKAITFLVDDRVAPAVDLSAFEMHESGEGKVYRADSDQFDALYDEVMGFYFEKMKDGTDRGSGFKEIIEAWKAREGAEHYLYANIADMLRIAVDASVSDQDPYVLLPESPEDIVVSPRYYYNRYLGQAVDKPEADGKQMIAFKKMPRERAIAALDRFAGSEKGILNQSVIEELRSKLEA